jgi:hypothetical protein
MKTGPIMKSEEMDITEEQNLADALQEYRAAAWAETGRDEQFWENQRRAVMAGIGKQKHSFRFKRAMAWSLAAVIVLIVIGLRLEVPRALPAPDFACGYDQDLLSDVDRLIHAPMPTAFEPAMVLVNDMDAIARSTKNIGSPEPRSK